MKRILFIILIIAVARLLADAPGIVSGTISDAVSGWGVPGVLVKIADQTIQTDQYGRYRLENISSNSIYVDFDALPDSGSTPLPVTFTDRSLPGQQRIHITHPDYLTLTSSVVILAGGERTFDVQLTPVNESSAFSLQLYWQQEPRDLDLHMLLATTPDTFDVSWSNSGHPALPPYALHKGDDVDGYGPEIIDVLKNMAGTYTAFVRNNTTDAELADSGARLDVVFQDSTFSITAPSTGEGGYWHVFSMNPQTGSFYVINQIYDHPPDGAEELQLQKSIADIPQQLPQIVQWAWDFDNDGVFDSHDQNPIYEYTEAGLFSVRLQVSTSDTAFEYTRDDLIHVIYKDVTPPANITNLEAEMQGIASARLSWENPLDTDFAKTIIRKSLKIFPQDTSEGVFVYSGADSLFIDNELMPGQVCYYSAFSVDTSGLYAAPDDGAQFELTVPGLSGLDGLTARILNIDATAYPEIVFQTVLRDSESKAVIYDLDPENTFITENDELVTGLMELPADSYHPKYDIVLIANTAASMADELGLFLPQFKTFLTQMQLDEFDLHYAAVTFNQQVEDVSGFTADHQDYFDHALNLSADGVEAEKSNLLNALDAANHMNFRPDAQPLYFVMSDNDFYTVTDGAEHTLYTLDTLFPFVNPIVFSWMPMGVELNIDPELTEFDITENYSLTFYRISQIFENLHIYSYSTDNTQEGLHTLQFTAWSDSLAGSDSLQYFYSDVQPDLQISAFAISSTAVICRWTAPGAGMQVALYQSTTGPVIDPQSAEILYSGRADKFILQDLQPDTEYYISVLVSPLGATGLNDAVLQTVKVTTLGEDIPQAAWSEQADGLNALNAVASDADGNIWLAADQGKIYRYSHTQTLETFTIDADIDFYAIAVLADASIIVAGQDDGGDGVVVRSLNDGNSWSFADVSFSSGLYMLQMVDSETGFAAGNDGSLLKTNDGGISWLDVSPYATDDLRALYFCDLYTGFAAGSNGALLKTINGGETWYPMFSGEDDFVALDFENRQNGWAAAQNGVLYSTDNGGQTWQPLSLDDRSVTDMQTFVQTFVTADADGNVHILADSTNGWQMHTLANNVSLNDLYLNSPFNGWVVSEDGKLYQLSTSINPNEYADAVFKLNKINASTYPQNHIFVSLQDSVTRDYFSDFSTSQFSVTEDGSDPSNVDVQTITDYENAQADFVFVVHSAAGNSENIELLQEKFAAFAQSLQTLNVDAAFNLITFTDKVESKSDWMNASECAQYLQNLNSPTGSGANALDALAFAEKLHFRPNAQSFIVLVSDAEFPTAESETNETAFTIDSITELLQKRDLSVLTQSSEYDGYTDLASQTNGKTYIKTDSTSIYTDFINDFSAQFVISYQATHSILDGSQHIAQVSLSVDDQEWSAAQKYTAFAEPAFLRNLQVSHLNEQAVLCNWQFSDSTTAFVTLVKNTMMAPQTPADGQVLYTGSASSFIDTTVNAGTNAWYAVFAANAIGIYQDEPTIDFLADFDDTEKSWQQQTALSPIDSLSAIAIVDSASLAVTSLNGRMFSSVTNGAVWQQKYENVVVNFSDIEFVDNNGWMVGSRNENMALILHCTDGGTTWNNQTSFTGNVVTDIFMLDAQTGWITDIGGHIQKTIDGGATWLPQYTGISSPLNGIHFVNYQQGLAFGNDGVVLITADGGENWLSLATPASGNIIGGELLNVFDGVLLTDGQILKTHNSGSSWTELNNDLSLTDIDFLSSDLGYACSADGKIYETVDGGLSWSLAAQAEGQTLLDIVMQNRQSGWAVGSGSTIFQLGPNTAALDDDLLVHIAHVDASNFPQVACVMTVLDSLQNSIATLAKSNFTVTENSESQTVSTLTGVSNVNPAVDIVFMIDSHSSFRNDLSAALPEFYKQLQNAGFHVRFGGISFADEINGSSSLNASFDQFREWLINMETTSTGSVNVLSALQRLRLFNFSENAQKLVLLFTNAENAPVIEMPEFEDITLVCATPENADWQEFEQNTNAINFSGSGATVLTKTAAALKNQYVLFYNTTQSTPDDEIRYVQVQVQQNDLRGQAVSGYFAGLPQISLNPPHLFSGAADRLNMQVMINSAVDLFSLQFSIVFDATVFDVTHAELGDFMNKGNALSEMQISKGEGRTTFLIQRPEGPSGVNGSGVLLNFELVQKSPDYDGQIQLQNIVAVDSDLQTLAFTAQPATVVSSSGVAILGDFDSDRDIDLADFAKLSTYWHANTAGDIGPATGTLPLLTPQPDGQVNHEDLFVFTQMWNWYHELLPENTTGLAKVASVQPLWKIDELDDRILLNLTVDNARDLAMGRLHMHYDPDVLEFISAQENTLLTSQECTVAMLQDHSEKVLQVAFSRLATRSIQPGTNGSGTLLTLEFQRLSDAATVVATQACEFRSSRNTGINVLKPENANIAMKAVPSEYRLSQNFPNPFNPTTTIEFDLPVDGNVKLGIYDLNGRLVNELVSGKQSAGRYKVEWNGKNTFGHQVASGVYFYRLKTSGFSNSHRMILLR